MRTRLSLGLAACSVLTLAACDLTPKISQEKLESALVDWLKAHDMAAKEIHCPDDQPMVDGHEFECTCEVHGADIPVHVTVSDAKAGTVEWKPKYMTVKRENVEKEIMGKPEFAAHDLKVDCHDPVWMSIPDSEWKCEIVDNSDNSKYQATIKFTDGEGTHEMKLEPMG